MGQRTAGVTGCTVSKQPICPRNHNAEPDGVGILHLLYTTHSTWARYISQALCTATPSLASGHAV